MRWRRRVLFAQLFLCLLFSTYVFSYAPAVALLFDPLPKVKYYHWDAPGIRRHPLSFYSPVDWLTDNTDLQTPLMTWAKLWGADDRIALAKFAREFDRPGLERYHYAGE